jgi:hypothetical protein
MSPYRLYRRSAVPRTLRTQREIAKAIRTLAGPDEDELLRQRRAEIAAIRRDMDVLKRSVRKLGEELPGLVMAELMSELKNTTPISPAYRRKIQRADSGRRRGVETTPTGRAIVSDPARCRSKGRSKLEHQAANKQK